MATVDPAIFERRCTRRPKAISKEILKLCADISPVQTPVFVTVKPEPSAELNNCFHNVVAKVAQSGGTILYGWSLWEWPRVFIEAEHHAVWNNNGMLIDITPHHPATRNVLFLPDHSRTYDFAHEKRVSNRRLSLSKFSSVAEWFAAVDKIIQFQEEHSIGVVITATLDEVNELQFAAAQALAQVYIDLARTTHRGAPCFCQSGRRFAVCCSKLIKL